MARDKLAAGLSQEELRRLADQYTAERDALSPRVRELQQQRAWRKIRTGKVHRVSPSQGRTLIRSMQQHLGQLGRPPLAARPREHRPRRKRAASSPRRARAPDPHLPDDDEDLDTVAPLRGAL
jgi:hypothetical protein